MSRIKGVFPINNTDYEVGVDSEKRMFSRSVEFSGLRESSVKGMAFRWVSDSYDYGAGETILLLKNEDFEKKLWVTKITCQGDTATKVVVHCPVCDTPSGDNITGVCLNRQKKNTAKSTAKRNETANSQGDIIGRDYIAANGSVTFNFEGALILGKDDCVAVDYVTDGTACEVTIEGFFE